MALQAFTGIISITYLGQSIQFHLTFQNFEFFRGPQTYSRRKNKKQSEYIRCRIHTHTYLYTFGAGGRLNHERKKPLQSPLLTSPTTQTPHHIPLHTHAHTHKQSFSETVSDTCLVVQCSLTFSSHLHTKKERNVLKF